MSDFRHTDGTTHYYQLVQVGYHLGVDFTSGCCSDQQSFYENGFPAVGFFESELQ